jgi:hypothetical protein
MRMMFNVEKRKIRMFEDNPKGIKLEIRKEEKDVGLM